ncbi:SAM-dependent methyltransferase, MidA family [Desulfuromonas soudanensis]|uniref:SAM-dependent methyltransferase, MidA family n=1 Tax=Desulfuromonas soudanensis TaxID=1603606 RepID=A0A0M4D0I1_9BACT|nr:SAM-dependent methyltransferase [Desulfuromonas soudanensis]ALC16058.1 SAM-dependent methyltransferase, MidA family [Desulfuromonas soudanensis]
MRGNEAIDSKPQLEAEIRRRIADEGGISFADYMALCLYHPEYGYYMAPRTRIGKEGDFFTSSSVHSLFGRLLARQLRQMGEILGKDDFTIAEQGAGEGHLCLDILDALAEEDPEFYGRVRYLLVEISPDNRSRQRQRLDRHLPRVDWCRLEDLQGMEGCVLSNELIDAFPVHLVEKRDGELLEVYVTESAGELTEELRPPATEALADHFHWLGVAPVEGNRAEVNLEARRWVAEVGRLLGRGFVLTVDYGYPAAELYAPFRRNGTLMCYHRHCSSDDPYRNPGAQDITAHVDFTALEREGEGVGLVPLYFGEQYRFLMGLGFVEALIELQARESDPKRAQALRLTLKNLIMPDGGMGETFKVLVQGKGVGRPDLLCARALRDLPLPPLGM